MSVVIAVDESKNAATIIVTDYKDLPKIAEIFKDIKHFREIKRNREEYLKNNFKSKLKKPKENVILNPNITLK